MNLKSVLMQTPLFPAIQMKKCYAILCGHVEVTEYVCLNLPHFSNLIRGYNIMLSIVVPFLSIFDWAYNYTYDRTCMV